MERARVASETLALIGLPALVFDDQGKVLAANHLIAERTDLIRWRAQDRVSLNDPRAISERIESRGIPKSALL